MVNGPWQLPQLAKAAMSDFAVAPIPVPAGGTPSSALGGEVWAAGNGPKSAKAAEVIKCVTTEANSLALSKLTNYVPSNEAAARQLAVTSPQFKSFVDEIGDAKGRTATLGVNYPKYSQALWTAVQSALAGHATPAAALDAAQQQATAR
jgi:multiple sugar transport system substrate-binding protein